MAGSEPAAERPGCSVERIERLNEERPVDDESGFVSPYAPSGTVTVGLDEETGRVEIIETGPGRYGG